MSRSRNTQAIILAGGEGTRLKPLMAVFPKPLVPLGNKAVLEILLQRLSRSGFKDITICTGYLAEMIMVLCGDGSKFGMNIRYMREESPLGTAAPLASVENISDTFIVMNGDLLTSLDFEKMLDFHTDMEADVTIAIHRRDVTIDFGVVERNKDKKFSGFIEKPIYHFDVSMGINIINKDVMRFIKPGEYMDMPDLILKVHESGGKVCCYEEDCFWLDIGRMEDYAEAQNKFEENEKMFFEEE